MISAIMWDQSMVLTKQVDINLPVLTKNDEYANANRSKLQELGVFAINIISSPGSGKTTLLESMAKILGDKMAVIEGDVQTARDAERVIAAGSKAIQIETGGACHLDAHRVGHALDSLKLKDSPCKILVIENVGNLVCPSTYDLGEHMKTALLSLPEGDDKVLKYPAIFSRISALVINKMDLAQYLDFDIDRAIQETASLNSEFTTFRISAKTGNGVEQFCQYLLDRQSMLQG